MSQANLSFSTNMRTHFLAKLRNRRNLLRIAGNSTWLFGDKALRVGLGLIVSAIVARHLGPDSFGILSLVFAYVLLFAPVAAFGLDGLVVRDLVRKESSKQSILGTTFIIKCCCAVMAFLLGFSLIYTLGFDRDGLAVLIVVGLGSLLFQAADVIDFRFQSQLNGRAIVMARSSAFIFVAGVRLVLVITGAPLVFFAATLAIEAAVAAVLLVLIYTRTEGDLRRWYFERSRAVELAKAALPIAISGFFVVAIMQIDKLMLGKISGSQAVGIYSAASLLSTAWYMVPVIVGASVAPTLTKMYEIGSDDYARRLQDVFSAVTFTALCIGVLTVLLSEALITLIFGSAYSPAALVLTIHIWTGLFVAHVSVRSRALLIEGNLSLLLLFSGLTLVANVLLNLLLIERYSEIGAAISSLISWGLCALLFPLASRRSRGFTLMLLKSFVPSTWIRAVTK